MKKKSIYFGLMAMIAIGCTAKEEELQQGPEAVQSEVTRLTGTIDEMVTKTGFVVDEENSVAQIRYTLPEMDGA